MITLILLTDGGLDSFHTLEVIDENFFNKGDLLFVIEGAQENDDGSGISGGGESIYLKPNQVKVLRDILTKWLE